MLGRILGRGRPGLARAPSWVAARMPNRQAAKRKEDPMSERETFLIDTLKTPLGRAVLIADEGGALRMHYWEDPEDTWRQVFHRRHGDAALVALRDPFGL